MEESGPVRESTADAERRGVARGKAEAKGEDLIRVLRMRFDDVDLSDVIRATRQVTDLDQLDRWLDLAVGVTSLSGFRRLAGLPTQHDSRRPAGKPRRTGTRGKT